MNRNNLFSVCFKDFDDFITSGDVIIVKRTEFIKGKGKNSRFLVFT